MVVDELLVYQAKKGDEQAFGRLYEKSYNDMYRYAYYVLGNADDAQDAVSDAFVDIFLGIEKLKYTYAFGSWAFKILTAKCKKKLKQYVNKTMPLDEEIAMLEVDHDEITDMKIALRNLTDEERMIISMSVFGGYSSDEISDIMNLKSSTVRSKLSRSLKKLQDVMEV